MVLDKGTKGSLSVDSMKYTKMRNAKNADDICKLAYEDNLKENEFYVKNQKGELVVPDDLKRAHKRYKICVRDGTVQKSLITRRKTDTNHTKPRARYLRLLKSKRMEQLVNEVDEDEFFFNKDDLWIDTEFTNESFGGEFLPRSLEEKFNTFKELKKSAVSGIWQKIEKGVEKKNKSVQENPLFSYKELLKLVTDRRLKNAIAKGLSDEDFWFSRNSLPEGVTFSTVHPEHDGKRVPDPLDEILANYLVLVNDGDGAKPSKKPKAPLIQHGETYREFSKRVRTDVRNAINDKTEYEQMDKPSRSLFVTMAVKYHFKKGIQLDNKWPHSNTLKKIYDQMQESEAKRRDQAITLLREYGVENVEAAADHLMANCSKSCAFKRLTDKLKKLLPDYHKEDKWVRAVAPKKPKKVSKKAQEVSKEAQKVSSGVRSLVADLHLLKQGKAKAPNKLVERKDVEAPQPANVHNNKGSPKPAKAPKHVVPEPDEVQKPAKAQNPVKAPKPAKAPKHVDPEPAEDDDAPIYNLDESFKVTDNTIQDLINGCVKQWHSVSSDIQNDYNQLRRCGDALRKKKSSSEVVQKVIDLIQKRLNVEESIMNFANGDMIDYDELDEDTANYSEESLDHITDETDRSYEIIKYQIRQFGPEKWQKSRLVALDRKYQEHVDNPQQ